MSYFCKGKGEVHPHTCYKGTDGEWSHSSSISLATAQEGVGGQRHDPATLPPGMTRYPLYMRIGGPQVRSGWLRKISPLPGFDPCTVQPLESLLFGFILAPLCVSRQDNV